MQPEQLGRLVRSAVHRCRLDLAGRIVLTEAASGAYASTAALAATAGAEVFALARASRYGSVDDVRDWTLRVTSTVSDPSRVHVVEELSDDLLARTDVLTNSGHLRPLDARLVGRLSTGAVVPLMMEAWEIGAGRVDVDLDALRSRGIAFAGTNERHPAVGVFDYLGVMAVRLLTEAGVAVHGTTLALLCDNPFSPSLERTLSACGAVVTTLEDPAQLLAIPPVDAVLVSLTPGPGQRLGPAELAVLARRSPGAVVVQFFGDVDREAAQDLGVACHPEPPPPHGHMGILPSAIGPEPIVRLQAGGLKVAQVLLVPPADRTAADREFLDVL